MVSRTTATTLTKLLVPNTPMQFTVLGAGTTPTAPSQPTLEQHRYATRSLSVVSDSDPMRTYATSRPGGGRGGAGSYKSKSPKPPKLKLDADKEWDEGVSKHHLVAARLTLARPRPAQEQEKDILREQLWERL